MSLFAGTDMGSRSEGPLIGANQPEVVVKTALKEGFASKGDIIVVAAGTPGGATGTTNMLKILNV